MQLLRDAFVALSADEAAGLHELTVFPLRALVNDNPWLRYPLILPGLGVALVATAAFSSLWRSMPRDTRRGLAAGGALFVTGALVIETVGGWFDPTLYGENLAYVALATLEEGCEMAGVTAVLLGLCRHAQTLGSLCVPGLGLDLRPADALGRVAFVHSRPRFPFAADAPGMSRDSASTRGTR